MWVVVCLTPPVSFVSVNYGANVLTVSPTSTSLRDINTSQTMKSTRV